jgi:hypothetical protein
MNTREMTVAGLVSIALFFWIFGGRSVNAPAWGATKRPPCQRVLASPKQFVACGFTVIQCSCSGRIG